MKNESGEKKVQDELDKIAGYYSSNLASMGMYNLRGGDNTVLYIGVISMILIPIIILAFMFEIFRLLLAFVFILIIGFLVFMYVYSDSTNLIKTNNYLPIPKARFGDLERTVGTISRAMTGMVYSQRVIRLRLRKILLLKIYKKYGLDEKRMLALNRNELKTILKKGELIDLIFTSEKDPKSIKRNKLVKKASIIEWKKTERLLKEIESWE